MEVCCWLVKWATSRERSSGGGARTPTSRSTFVVRVLRQALTTRELRSRLVLLPNVISAHAGWRALLRGTEAGCDAIIP